MTKLAQPLLAHYHNPNPMLHLMGLDSTWLNTTLLDLIWRDLTRLDSTWRNLTRLDSTWRNLTRLIPPYWLPSLSKYLWWQKNGLAHEGKRERGVIFSARFWCHGTTLSWVFIHARFVNVKRGHKVAQFTSQQHLIILIRNAHNELKYMKKFVKLQ